MLDNPAELAAMVADGSAMYYKRRDALKKLFKTDPASARPLLDAVAADKEKVLRRDAAEMLGAFRDKGAVALLLKALSDEDSDVKKNAVRSLKTVGAPESLDALRNMAASEPSIFVRREAEEAVKAIEKAGLSRPSATGPEPAPMSASAARAADGPKPVPVELQVSAPKPPPWKSEAAPAPEPQDRAEQGAREMPSWKQAKLDPADASGKPGLAQLRPNTTAPVAAQAPVQAQRQSRNTIFDKLKPRQEPDLSKKTEPLPPWKRDAGASIGVGAPVPVPEPAGASAPAWRPPRKADAQPRQESKPQPQQETTRKARKAVAEMSESSVLCPKCQWVLKPGQRFCTFCGFAMEPASAAVGKSASSMAGDVPVASIVSRGPKVPPRQGAGQVQKPSGSSSNLGCAIAAIVVGAIVVVGIAAAAISSGDSRPQKSAVQQPASQRVTRPAPVKAAEPNAAPTAEGRPVVMAMKNGQTVYAFLLSETDDFYRVRVKNGIYNVPKDDVRKVINK